MHTTRRTLVLAAFLVALLPLGGAAVLGDARGEIQQQFDTVLNKARDSYRTRTGANSRELASKAIIEKGEKRLAEIARQKRYVRLQLAAAHRSIGLLKGSAESALAERQRKRGMVEQQRVAFQDFLRRARLRRSLFNVTPSGAGLVLRRIAVASLGQDIDTVLRDDALAQTQRALLTALADAERESSKAQDRLTAVVGEAAHTLVALENELDSLRHDYGRELHAVNAAERTLVVSEAALRQLKNDMARVHRDILSLQAELARIDARIRSKAARGLVEKGLWKPSDTDAESHAAGAMFLWPVRGALSAGFHDAHYRSVMGVPHEGMDIAVPQRTPVKAAADGIVFVVREGGDTGYTYILIGHQDGYATLYGHINQTQVAAGQEVRQGEVIGLSGGAPGTPGAGPLTTGAHLHFEMIQQGVNIDPKEVLP